MKSRLIVLACLAAIYQPAAMAGRVEQSLQTQETFDVSTSQPTLHISNIWGDVKVRTGKEGVITLNLKERRSAPTQELYDRSLVTLGLYTDADSSGLSLEVGQRNNYRSHGNPCRGCRVDYEFDLTVPPGTQVDVNTVNDGKIDIAGINGLVRASNVNGPIFVSGLRDCESLDNVNGVVELGFSRAPTMDCEIETINGDITLALPEDAGLNVAMDLFNGRLVSEFPVDPLAIPAVVEHSKHDGRNRYQISQPAGVSLAGGGPTFIISSLNGEIHIQKTK